MESNLDLCKGAAVAINALKAEQIASQKKLIEQQQKQLWVGDCIVKKKSSAPSIEMMSEVVKSAVQADRRSKNFIIYGVD